MMNFCFLYNPSTNRERSYRNFLKLKDHTKDWPNVSYKTSESREHLTALAQEAAMVYEVVVACGGDGTVRDVAVAIMDSEAKLGIVPLGSGNDFSKSVGLCSGLEETLKILKTCRSRPVSIGKCNDFYFINTLGFGFDGQTNYYASRSSIRIGSLRYVWSALKTNFKREAFKTKIRLDNRQLTGENWIMISAANGRVEGGNFIIAPDATPFDELLRLITIKPISKWILPFVLPLFLVGSQRWLSQYACRKAEKINLDFDRPVFIHTDGEQIHTEATEFDIELVSSALQVIC